MNLYRVTNTNNLTKLGSPSEQTLRPGQIIQGKILRLFPENKAEILLGKERLIASLEVGLQAGGKYHFQVQSIAESIQLKVMGEKLQGEGEADIGRLLSQLGLKESKPNLNLLATLTRLKIPFDKQQLTQAVHLLKEEKNKPAAIKILTEMIAQKLPIKDSFFKALFASNNNTLSEQLQTVVQQIQNNTDSSISKLTAEAVVKDSQASSMKMAEANLLRTLNGLIGEPMSFKAAFVEEILGRQPMQTQNLFRTLQGLGLSNLHTEFPKWVSEWTAFSKKENITTAALPLQINDQEMIQILSRISEQRPVFNEAVKTFLNRWDQQLNFHQLINASMSKEDFNRLMSDFQKEILPFFQENKQPTMKQLINTPESLGAFHSAIKALATGEELSRLIQVLQKSMSDEQFMSLEPKQQFLQLQKSAVNTLGLNYESQLMTEKDQFNQTETIKGMLLQLVANPSETVTQDSKTQLLHLINGIQLQSVQETQTMVQANLQIPAERLGLVKDLELEFEGKKNNNGEINPDYCRILFYLELGNLKETIIDLNIQQRMVSLTVFNNHEAIKAAAELFKDKLEKNLESMNYKLSALHYKNIEEKERQESLSEISFNASNQQGVDYRI